MNRRDFIKTSVAAGAAFGFPAIVSARSPNSKICHACIGTANMADHDMRQFNSFNDLCEVTAICDVDANFLKVAKEKIPNARVYSDWRELLEKEGDKLDSLNISTPDHTHTIIAANAMRMGKHVYCQKPLCKKIDECRLLRNLADEKGVITQLGTQFASTLGDRQIVNFLKSGIVGPVKRAVFFSTRDGMSRRKRVLNAPAKVPEYLDWEKWIGPAPMTEYRGGNYHPLLWRVWKDFGSGWIGDLCIHVMTSPWKGMELGTVAPIAVHAEIEKVALKDPIYKIAWPRWSHITWEMPGVKASGGKPFTFEWVSGYDKAPEITPEFLPPKEYEELFVKSPFKKRPLEGRVIEGEDGWILAPHGGSSPVVMMKNGNIVKPEMLEKGPNHFRQFIEKISKGEKDTRCSFAWTTWMMESIIMGAVCEQLPNRRFTWNVKNGCFDNAPDANALIKSNYRDGWKLAGL